MNRFLAFLGVLTLLTIGVLGLGYYLGWFHLTTDGTGHNPNITVTMDRDKIQGDKEKAKEKVEGAGHKVKEKTGAATDTGKEEAPRP